MIVLLVNLTDAPGCKHPPTQVDIYNKTIDPGGSLRIPADLVDKNIRALEARGILSIGPIPSWYANAKANRGRTLSPEEKTRRIVARKLEVKGPKGKLTVIDDLSAVAARR